MCKLQFGYLETNTKVLKKNSSKVFRFLKMTVLLKDPKGALWCSMTSKKNLCGLIKNSEAFKWLLSERRCTN